jgi:hypothetical protein
LNISENGGVLTILTSLIFIITQCTVEGGKLAKLVPLKFVLAFGDRSGSLDDIVDEFLGFVDLVFGVGHDQAMQILFLIASVGSI